MPRAAHHAKGVPADRRAQANESQLEDWQLANLREMRRERDHAIATPLSLVTRLARATAEAEVRWLEAKQQSNFELFAPHLEEVVALTRDKAQALSRPSNSRRTTRSSTDSAPAS